MCDEVWSLHLLVVFFMCLVGFIFFLFFVYWLTVKYFVCICDLYASVILSRCNSVPNFVFAMCHGGLWVHVFPIIVTRPWVLQATEPNRSGRISTFKTWNSITIIIWSRTYYCVKTQRYAARCGSVCGSVCMWVCLYVCWSRTRLVTTAALVSTILGQVWLLCLALQIFMLLLFF